MQIISHITFETNYPERSSSFYDEVLSILGFGRIAGSPYDPPAYTKAGMLTIYLCPKDKHAPTWENSTHIAFVADTEEVVNNFHKSAIRMGGTCAGIPSPNPHYGENCYSTCVRDPDGNKLQAVYYASDSWGLSALF